MICLLKFTLSKIYENNHLFKTSDFFRGQKLLEITGCG